MPITDNNLTGVAGEYFVAAELSKMGYIASVTLKNTRGIDILATNKDASKSVGIQVKASRGNAKDWQLHKKAENYYSKNLFYVFVNLKSEKERPDFFIVPSRIVANYVKESHAQYLKTPRRDGKLHEDSTRRKFRDPGGVYQERWDFLGL
ncbi:MAG: aspartate ammonia-lyase [Candidatus Doudnabacteria bacterium RIFCSPHIGHO2_01_52_17]|uniref:Aspartate ammonia-lyase n=1 Tax=Candidatus Doudnabacteria bacterium RIFCSPHIGHO2_01_52_17 TaxID=1817820 RepID=A0A1F5NFK8_9BACT|nr:MAG: aspartate ammonia-lyase [Candidatus Doudnabacteria bacterium RIFCSPHIGHO2_01_52_17]